MTEDAVRARWGEISTLLSETMEAAGGTARISVNEGASSGALADLEHTLQAELDDDHRRFLEMSDGIVIDCKMPDDVLGYVVHIGGVVEIGGASPLLAKFLVFAINADSNMLAYGRRPKSDGTRRRVAAFDNENVLLCYTKWTFTSWLSTLPDRAARYVAIHRSPGGEHAYLESWTETEDDPLPL
jgi:hypothetical protein